MFHAAPSLPPPTDDARRELGILTRLAAPIVLAQLGMIGMHLVDTAIVGRVSVHELAGVAMGGTLVFAATTPCFGVCLALEPLAAQALGAGDPERARAALRATLQACALLVVPSVLLAYAATFALVPLGVEASLVPRVRAFLLGRAPGALFFLLFQAGKTFLQARGETRHAVYASVLANVVNAVACALFVRGDEALAWVGLAPRGLPRLGAFGAGLSSSLSALVLAAAVLVPAHTRATGAGRRPSVVVPLARVLALGTPMGLQMLAEVGVFTVVAIAAARLGPAVVAAHQIALGLASFTFMGALGVSGATAVRVGHAVGAGVSPRRVGLLGLALGAAVMTLGAAAFALAPRWLMRCFTPDAAVIETGASLLGIAALFQLFDGLQAVATGALRGAGDVRFPFVANVASHWFLGFPVAITLGFGLGLGAPGLWWGLTCGLVAIAIALTARFVALSGRQIARL